MPPFHARRAPCPPDGLWLETGGTAHLFGGEEGLLDDLDRRLSELGLTPRIALADTPPVAFALARHAPARVTIAPPGSGAAPLGDLPVTALGLGPELAAAVQRLGFETVSHLREAPRAFLAQRLGPALSRRLDQAAGLERELLAQLPVRTMPQRRMAFAEPLLTAESLLLALTHLLQELCEDLEQAGLGIREMQVQFERVDGAAAVLRATTVRPSRDPAHLRKLLEDRIIGLDPGLGVEALHLAVPHSHGLHWQQEDGRPGPRDLANLVDRLLGRLGERHVFRSQPVESFMPERSVGTVPAFPDTAPPARQAPREQRAAGAHPPPGQVPHLVWSSAQAEQAAPPDRVPPRLTVVRALPGQTDRRPSLAEDPPLLAWEPRNPPSDAETRERRRQGRWPSWLRPPARIIDPPLRLQVSGQLAGQAPLWFHWRRPYRVRRAQGPDRVLESWWTQPWRAEASRDYFQVEVEGGQRFWLYRRAFSQGQAESCAWFLHGVF